MKIEYIDGDKTVNLNINTNYIDRLNHLLLTCGWFTDEKHMVETCAGISRDDKEITSKNPGFNTETILSLIVLITENARKAGHVHEVEVDETGKLVDQEST